VNQPVEVVVADLHSASASLADAAQRLQDGLTSVDHETSELLGSGWKGGAASAYAPVWQKWNEGATKVVEGLQRMSELLDIAGREYAKTDESAAQSVGATMQGQGGGSGRPGGSGAGAPAVSPASGAGGTSGAGTGGTGSAMSDAVGQAVSSAGQLPQMAMQPLSQAGQAIGGLVASAAQLASGLAEKAESAENARDEDERNDAPGGAESGGEQHTGAAPVDVAAPEPQRAVERRGE